MKTMAISTVRHVPVQDTVDVLCTALESGWEWWGGFRLIYLRDDAPCAGPWYDRLAKDPEGYVIAIEALNPEDDGEEWTDYTFTVRGFATAWMESRFANEDPGNIDICDADVILQKLLFGEVVYG